jgi:K+-transporting ATPase KdpF subunit
MDGFNVHSGGGGPGSLLPVPESLRKDLKGENPMMLLCTMAIVAFLFVYLFVALVRPEWF